VEPPPAPHEIIALGVQDAGELLTLQRAAYVVEAQAHDDPRLPPLTETLAEVRAEIERHAGPQVRALTLFTGDRSHRNLSLYARRGYLETHRTDAGNHELVHMRKPLR
jgi:hypothetical protein